MTKFRLHDVKETEMGLNMSLVVKILSKHLKREISNREVEYETFQLGEYVCGVWYEGKFYGIAFDDVTNAFWVREIEI